MSATSARSARRRAGVVLRDQVGLVACGARRERRAGAAADLPDDHRAEDVVGDVAALRRREGEVAGDAADLVDGDGALAEVGRDAGSDRQPASDVTARAASSASAGFVTWLLPGLLLRLGCGGHRRVVRVLASDVRNAPRTAGVVGELELLRRASLSVGSDSKYITALICGLALNVAAASRSQAARAAGPRPGPPRTRR